MTQIQNEDLVEIFDLRKMIECYALKQSWKNITLDKYVGLFEEEKRLYQHYISHNPGIYIEEYHQNDIQLHLLIVQGWANTMLHGIYNGIFNLIKMFIRLSTHQSNYLLSINEHIDILESILNRQLYNAVENIMNHLNNTLERFTGSI